jgi:hypothetical protein
MSTVSELDILSRLFDQEESPMSVEMARGILAVHFGKADIKRMNNLAAKARAGTLTPGEVAEAESYERAGHVLAMLHSLARMALKQAGGPGVAP